MGSSPTWPSSSESLKQFKEPKLKKFNVILVFKEIDMARNCLKCGEVVPRHVLVNGKKRNCQRRKYCFVCSPFGEHNTRQLEYDTSKLRNGRRIKTCPDCKEEHDQKGNRCFRCFFQKRKKEVSKKVKNIVGPACWICGYNKTKRNLCFHHVDESKKLFGLTTRELMLKWERVLTEMRKCVFVCANCHGEIHEGLIGLKRVKTAWKKNWSKETLVARALETEEGRYALALAMAMPIQVREGIFR